MRAKRSKSAPWRITVVKRLAVVEEVLVPAHRLGARRLEELLRALLARHQAEAVEDMLPFYLNRRAGVPERRASAEVIRAWAHDHSAHGYMCGDSECFVSAMQATEPDVAQAIRDVMAHSAAASVVGRPLLDSSGLTSP